MPIMPKVSLSTVIHLFIVAVFLGLLFYSKNLYEENKKLEKQYIEINVVYEEKVKALTTCSTATSILKKQEEELTKAAKVAVAEAKKESIIEFKASNAYLFKKPKAPVITPQNIQNFGGEDTMVQLKDYLATQQMINEYIDEVAARVATK